jgi:hypothetical protein
MGFFIQLFFSNAVKTQAAARGDAQEDEHNAVILHIESLKSGGHATARIRTKLQL